MKIRFGQPVIVGRELEYLREAIEQRHLSSNGAFTHRCESWLAAQMNASRAHLTHSAIVGLELAALLAELGPGDEAIMAPSREAAMPQPEAPAAEPKAPVAMISPQEREFRAKLKELRDHLTKNAENVGGKFPEEARKMHYGEIEHRSIYGEASPQEAKDLLDEGVEFQPLPMLPDERN